MISELFKQAQIRWDDETQHANALFFGVICVIIMACLFIAVSGCSAVCVPHVVYEYKNGRMGIEYVSYGEAKKKFLTDDSIAGYEYIWCNKAAYADRKAGGQG